MVRGITSCIKEFKRDTILTPIFVIGEVAFDVLIPMMTGKLLDEGVKAGSMTHIVRYGVLVVAMAMIALLLGALSGRFAARAATGLSRNLRREMYRTVQQFSFANIDKFSTGGIITRLTTDVTNVQMAFMMLIRVAVRCPVMLICAWTLTFTINPKLAEAQVHGGMSMGLGYALSEEILFDAKARPLNPTLLDYKIPTAMDTPDLSAYFVEVPDPTGPYGNKALGEPPSIPVAPAVRNALLHATGVAVDSLPLSQQKLIEHFRAAGLLED